jgi:D-glycero-D-manno-heptose 1,7-bisphosphate phosphatase
LTRAVFLDRDGVINRKAPEGRYVTRWEDFHVLPGVVEGIKLLNRTGFCVIVVTNQRCVAKGLMTLSDLENIHQRMCDLLARAGATVDAIYYCPHALEPSCSCRKPAPGMP